MKVLICGSNYGSSYLRAVICQPATAQIKLTLAGILSKGSNRSQALAKQHHIAHYSCADDVDADNIDIACVALPSPVGQQLVLDLLAKGIHVLCEHPLDSTAMRAALNMANKHQRMLFVNAHFADLPAPQAFINAFVKTRQHGRCLHYDLGVNLRTLYSGLDLLGRCQGGLESLTVSRLRPAQEPEQESQKVAERPTDDAQPLFANLLIYGPDINVSLLCQRFTSAVDDGSANLLNHRFSAIFNFGSLNLSETNGPVQWLPNTSTQQWQNVYSVEHSVINLQQFGANRDSANLALLNKLAVTIKGGDRPAEQQPQYLIHLSSLWDQCTTLLA
ncbi:MAG: thiazolinyl reductase component of yersiniabactin synthetase [Phenylobacterium sp.]|jgi:thiazolinyl reductase component of yersiniabactin synthetase